MKHILKCPACGRYTMKDKCPKCNEVAINPKPVKYRVDDRYGEYRRKARKSELEKRGLL
ncbi:RNA-protein complex protein Nop10 [Candidatus Woesearchaeota archaeon]|nr:RNA-protein complex protein Nop10 [Candidatus Woesearchaeota archaeon]